MAREKTIFYIDEQFDVIYIYIYNKYSPSRKQLFQNFADMCKEVKVVYDKTSGCYETVVIAENDQLICICL